MRLLPLLSLLLAAAAPDPYPDAHERVSVKVGERLTLEPPGTVVQMICDGVDTLIAVEAEGMKVHVRGLKPGVAACSFRGVRPTRPGDEAVIGEGVTDYRLLWRIEVVAPPEPGRDGGR